MTSELIACLQDGTIEVWLQEIAYQLALANDATDRFDKERKEEREAEQKASVATLGGAVLPRGNFD